MRVVLDTNIYVSALIAPSGNPAKILEAWLSGHFDVLVSPPIIEEILRVTAYERIQKKYPLVKETRLEYVELINAQSILVKPEQRLAVIVEDESDNRYIECGVAGNAQYIVSGDEHLLKVGIYRDIVLISPASFLAIMAAGEV